MLGQPDEYWREGARRDLTKPESTFDNWNGTSLDMSLVLAAGTCGTQTADLTCQNLRRYFNWISPQPGGWQPEEGSLLAETEARIQDLSEPELKSTAAAHVRKLRQALYGSA